MAYDIRLPNITGTTEKEQLKQLRSYLHQFVEQMQWVLNDISMNQGGAATVQGSQQANTSKSDGEKDGVATFDSIKALIIKSADIVDSYYEEINRRLVGVYVAESDFGKFRSETEQAISATSTAVEQKFVNHEEIKNSVEKIDESLRIVNASIKSGQISSDENGAVYGIEIGETRNIDGVEKFNQFARFTADRLSFYDQNGYEVAYISDDKLFVSNAEITSSYKIGGFVDTVMAKGDVVTKWVGGEG